jgi:hypothetical protein
LKVIHASTIGSFIIHEPAILPYLINNRAGLA